MLHVTQSGGVYFQACFDQLWAGLINQGLIYDIAQTSWTAERSATGGVCFVGNCNIPSAGLTKLNMLLNNSTCPIN